MDILRRTLLGIALCVSLSCFAATPDAGFQLYWDKFRAASLSKDYPTLVTLIHFPLEIKGTTDDSPVQKYTADSITRIFPRLMAQMVTQYKGDQLTEIALEEIIKKTTTVNIAKSDKYIRVEDLQFTQINGTWYLTEAYLPE